MSSQKKKPAPKRKTTTKKKVIKKATSSRSRKMTKAVFEDVCNEIQVTHKGLHTLCKERNTSAPAFYDLMDGDKSGQLSELYTRAKDRQADFLAEQILEQSYKRDEDHTPFTGSNVIQRDRLITDSLKFIASKLKPKKYGDKLDVTTDGEKIEPRVFNLDYNKKDKK